MPIASMSDDILFQCFDGDFEDTLIGQARANVNFLFKNHPNNLKLQLTLNGVNVGILYVCAKFRHKDETKEEREIC
jgi:hypothetical protein